MKRVIGGKVYNAETAEEIFAWDNGLSTSDFRNCYEVLYKSPKGQLFMYGSGGAMTEYSQSCGNGSCGSSRISLVEIADAEEWLEDHNAPPEAYEKIGVVIEEG